MSDHAECDVCGAEGRRRNSRWAPEGWFYGFSPNKAEGTCEVVMVCSEACCRAFFKPWDTGRTLDGPPEKAPTGAHLRARLHALLDDFSVQRVLAALATVVQDRHRAGGNPCKPFRWNT